MCVTRIPPPTGGEICAPCGVLHVILTRPRHVMSMKRFSLETSEKKGRIACNIFPPTLKATESKHMVCTRTGRSSTSLPDTHFVCTLCCEAYRKIPVVHYAAGMITKRKCVRLDDEDEWVTLDEHVQIFCPERCWKCDRQCRGLKLHLKYPQRYKYSI